LIRKVEVILILVSFEPSEQSTVERCLPYRDVKKERLKNRVVYFKRRIVYAVIGLIFCDFASLFGV